MFTTISITFSDAKNVISLQFDLEFYVRECLGEINWPVAYAGTSSTMENGNTRGKQTMLYSKCVAIFRSKLFQNKSIWDTVRLLMLLYNNSMKTICFLSKYNFIYMRILKNIDFWKSELILLKWNFDILLCERVISMKAIKTKSISKFFSFYELFIKWSQSHIENLIHFTWINVSTFWTIANDLNGYGRCPKSNNNQPMSCEERSEHPSCCMATVTSTTTTTTTMIRTQ